MKNIGYFKMLKGVANKMKNIKYIREPGYIYDLIFCFVYYFNRIYCLNSPNYMNYNKSKEDTDFYNRIMYDFTNISDESLLFFYINDSGKSLFGKYYFQECSNDFLSNYNLTFIQRMLLDTQSVAKNVFDHYFPELKKEKIDFDFNSLSPQLGELIKKSKHDEKIKNHLFYFFLNPVFVIEKLIGDLNSINTILASYYEKNYHAIIECQQKINDDELLSEKLKQTKNNKLIIDQFEYVYISICLLNKNCVNGWFINENPLLLFGYDFEDAIAFSISQLLPINLEYIGNALSERNRIEILDVLLKKEEASLRDLESELNLSATNAYYHISLMLKANLIKSRNEGKIVIYSLNKTHFTAVVNHLYKYTNIKKKKEEESLL